MRPGLVPITALVLVLLLGGWARAEPWCDEPAPPVSTQPAGDPALTRIAELELAGGVGATEELKALLGRVAEPGTRRVALQALGRVGLRTEGVAVLVRRLARTATPQERAAAVEALGRVGDGRDVPLFLAAMRSEEGVVRSAALRGLRRLSGRRLSASSVRCRLWWDVTGPGLDVSVQRALAATEQHLDRERGTRAFRTTIAREGWVALPKVLETVRLWLRSGDHRLRAEALHAVATLRLADAVEDVEKALTFVNATDAAAAVGAALVFGLEVSPQVLEYAGIECKAELACPATGRPVK